MSTRTTVQCCLLIVVWLSCFGVSLFGQAQIASLRPHQELRWQRISPSAERPDGPVLYQLVFRFVAHDGTLIGTGSMSQPLAIAPGGVGTTQLATGAVMGSTIASGQVVKSLNGVFDTVTLSAGTGISITPSGQTLTIANTAPAPLAWGLTGTNGTGCAATPCADFLGTTDSASLEFRVQNNRALRIEPATDSVRGFSPNIIGGFNGNAVSGAGVGGATIAGGGANLNPNTVTGSFGTVGGGIENAAGSNSSTVAGGAANTASGNSSTVAGGFLNTASGISSTVAGGFSNTAGGDHSFAAGRSANADANGCFVWSDGTAAPTCGATANRFVALASGGTFFYSSSNFGTGVTLSAGSGSWASVSDRNLKEHFAEIDSEQLLARVLALPITSWNYKSQDAAIRHLGPMAQDFYAAFHVGEDDKHITTIDESGVALAAIQGLNQKLEDELRQKDAQLSAQQRQIELLQKQVQAMMARVEAVELNQNQAPRQARMIAASR